MSTIMAYRGCIAIMTLAAGLCMLPASAQAFDDSKYPDWKGKWVRPPGERPVWVRAGDKAPLTPEYQAIFDWNTADQKAGGMGTEPSWMCLPPGMPRAMNVFESMEIVVTPATSFFLLSHIHDNRRVYTDGRDWPSEIEPTFAGYSIGRWTDSAGGGSYDTLEVETRVKERIYLDKSDSAIMWDEITTIDHALTRPWTVNKKFARDPSPRPNWQEAICTENNPHVRIQNDNYFIGANGMLMPAKKGQQAPDLKYFGQAQK
jgi:hypothetical protein